MINMSNKKVSHRWVSCCLSLGHLHITCKSLIMIYILSPSLNSFYYSHVVVFLLPVKSPDHGPPSQEPRQSL